MSSVGVFCHCSCGQGFTWPPLCVLCFADELDIQIQFRCDADTATAYDCKCACVKGSSVDAREVPSFLESVSPETQKLDPLWAAQTRDT